MSSHQIGIGLSTSKQFIAMKKNSTMYKNVSMEKNFISSVSLFFANNQSAKFQYDQKHPIAKPKAAIITYVLVSK